MADQTRYPIERFEKGRFTVKLVNIDEKRQRLALIANNEIQCSFDLSEIGDLMSVAWSMQDYLESGPVEAAA